MIYFEDNFLNDTEYKAVQDDIVSDEFKGIEVGDKVFHVHFPSDSVTQMIERAVSAREGGKVKNILSFYRIATDTIDTDWRIHSDQKIEGVQPARAVVLYLSPSPEPCVMTGTAFWKYHTYGHELPENTPNEEFDRTLLEDSNDTSKWELSSVVGHAPNRMVSYPASYFHSKYPNVAWPDGRVVFVMFYSYE